MKKRGCEHCSNGGTCIVIGPELSNYKCICPVGHRGRHCEADINECETQASKPCPSGADCVNSPGSYSCRCPAGQTLLRFQCVSKVQCSDDPCLNDGTCYTVRGSEREYVCECPLGFKGMDCEVAVQECADDYCGQHGLCLATPKGPLCQCLSTHTGARCGTLLPISREWTPKPDNVTRSSPSPAAFPFADADTVAVTAAAAVGVVGLVVIFFLAATVVRLKVYQTQAAGLSDYPLKISWSMVLADTCRCRSFSTATWMQLGSLPVKPVRRVTQGRLGVLLSRLEQNIEKKEQEVQELGRRLDVSGFPMDSRLRRSVHELQRLIQSV